MFASTSARRAGDDRARSSSARIGRFRPRLQALRRRARPSGASPCAPPSLVNAAAASIRIEDRLRGFAIRRRARTDRGFGLRGFDRRLRLDAIRCRRGRGGSRRLLLTAVFCARAEPAARARSSELWSQPTKPSPADCVLAQPKSRPQAISSVTPAIRTPPDVDHPVPCTRSSIAFAGSYGPLDLAAGEPRRGELA